ncbi:ketopantoate reductase family protein [Paenibacillus beijingensis]|uniref:2-dehydropantoate 2-reductase n=1 Tax=Paenibacillus beijingensis TaxID=1126833 RepID=A0A0D5NMK6_9BACL|nr:2-dehydropantoate 2-reductase [Paenibacillus beijingensis]AJY76133.1 hypothetical protein VN24_18185 [Paenibacillus beijingensis]
MNVSVSIAVVGAGSMGGLFGARLAEAGCAVTLYDTWKEHVDQIQNYGLQVSNGTTDKTFRIPAFDSPQADKPYHYVIVFTKNQHTEDAINRFRPLFGPDTYVVSLQNGIGSIEILPKYFPRERIIVGVTTCSSDLLGPGAIKSGDVGTTYVAKLSDDNPDSAHSFAALLNEAGLPAAVSGDTLKIIWEKLAFNAAINPVCAITRMFAGEAENHPLGKQLTRFIIEEVTSVANQLGIGIDSEQIAEKLHQACLPEHSGHHLPSMLQHVLKKQSTEIEAINGAVIRLAEQLKIDVPHNRTVYQLIKMMEEKYMQP